MSLVILRYGSEVVEQGDRELRKRNSWADTRPTALSPRRTYTSSKSYGTKQVRRQPATMQHAEKNKKAGFSLR